ncbi:MAG: NUDIX hydrolase [Acidobacteriota bacterium]
MLEEVRLQTPRWLQWAQEIQALAQTGLHYCQTEYDRQRYRRLMEIAAEMAAAYGQGDCEVALRLFLEQPGYATPKVDVRGAVIEEGRILLVQERSDERWCLPGGWADVGETPAEMVVREVEEESGLRVRPVRLVGVYDANRGAYPEEFFHAYKLIFLCERTGGEPRGSDETLAAAFFSLDDLPPLSEQRTNRRHLADVFGCHRDPVRPAVFD